LGGGVTLGIFLGIGLTTTLVLGADLIISLGIGRVTGGLGCLGEIRLGADTLPGRTGGLNPPSPCP